MAYACEAARRTLPVARHEALSWDSAEQLMIWYVALVAVLNIGLGYAVAIYLGAGRKNGPLPKVGESKGYESYNGGEEYESDGGFAESEEENDLESVSAR
jgi:hypothetical protein